MKYFLEEEFEEISDINMIPLIDVMIVLLIIFMLAAPLSLGGVKVDLPRAVSKQAILPSERVVLSIDKEGKYFLEEIFIKKENLFTGLQEIFRKRRDKKLYIRGDQEVSYGAIIYAMVLAKKAGATKMSMLTYPIDEP